MSRSYKKTPRSGDSKDKFFKRYANRKIRHKSFEEENYQNKAYKKEFCSYNICDYEWVGTTFEEFYQDAIKNWHKWGRFHNKPYPSREECLERYSRWYKRK